MVAEGQAQHPRLPVELRADKLARRERIIRAATDLLAEAEYEKVQIRDVAEAAGVALATVYRYFPSKDLLYAEAIVRWSQEFFDGILAKHENGGATDKERLRLFLRRTVRSLGRSPQFIRAFMILTTSTNQQVQDYIAEFYSHYDSAFASSIQVMDGERAADVRMVIRSVYTVGCREWAAGRRSIDSVEEMLNRALDLIFGP